MYPGGIRATLRVLLHTTALELCHSNQKKEDFRISNIFNLIKVTSLNVTGSNPKEVFVISNLRIFSNSLWP
jgi:hypothetical protein